ncbi:MAG TPA: class I SAM-dependent rRNA methyltransferase [Candidatus Kapabacteria bacterium]|nr:class I SAM-dependent rRNA methyltransferase [Candidatus Kapabacteria bacterium]
MKTIEIKKNHHKRVLSGHLWIFSNELVSIPKYSPGELVEVFYENQSLGFGFYNPNSLISCRLLKYSDTNIQSLIYERILNAKKLRELLIPNANSYRLIYGESDLLPGLIVDKYEDYFVIQILSYGFEIRKEILIDTLLSIFKQTKGIISRGNSKLRELEGLANTDEILFGSIPDNIEIEDNGIKITVNLISGQKTGYFLDQRYNRHYLRAISKDKTILDVYCNLGGFGLNAYKGGAKEVTFIDVSAQAIENTKKNLLSNNFDNYYLCNEDVFSFLPNLISQGKKYDIIVLDPPAFAKNKKSIYTAEAAYAKLNRYGIKLLNKNGFLISSSCSHYIDERKFNEIISKEIAKSGRNARLVYKAGHSPDHPILPSMPETEYLKYLVHFVE